jgi:hypothetical protein
MIKRKEISFVEHFLYTKYVKMKKIRSKPHLQTHKDKLFLNSFSV